MFGMNRSFYLEWGWVYWSGFIYHRVLCGLRGKIHKEIYARVAEEVGNFSVLDLCCGDGALSRWITHSKYTGIELNPRFVKMMRRRHIDVIEGDVQSVEFPSSDCAVLIESLYQFLPNGLNLLSKILSHPFRKVIVVESMTHVASHPVWWISLFAKWSTRVKGRIFHDRFSPGDFKALMSNRGFTLQETYPHQWMAVWNRETRPGLRRERL